VVTATTGGYIFGAIFDEMLAGLASIQIIPIIVNPIIIGIPYRSEVIAIVIGVIEQTATRVSCISIIRTIPTINRAMNVFHV
jgi:hypothetical protein